MDNESVQKKILRIGIVGSRDYPNEQQVKDMIYLLPDNTEIVSGGQPMGVDGWAKKYAQERELKYTEFAPAHYHKYAPYDVRNYHERNRQIAEYCDIVFAFMHHHSSGTQSTVDFCKQLGTPVVIVTPQTDILTALKNIQIK